MVWTLVEPGVAIVASSLVTIRPLLRQMRLKGFESSQRSHSRGFWSRRGRSTGGLSGNNQNNSIAGGGGASGFSFGLNSKGQWSQVPGDNNEDLKLKDLEAGYFAGSSKSLGGGKEQGRGRKLGSKGFVSSSGETTLTSRASTQTQPKIGAGAGTAAVTTLQEDHYHHHHEQQKRGQEADLRSNLDVGIAVTKDPSISPVSSRPIHSFGPGRKPTPSSDSSSESVFFIEGVKASILPCQAQVQAQRSNSPGDNTTNWPRDERPHSVEASDEIQGLRYPVAVLARRGATTTMNGGDDEAGRRASSRFSIQGLPIQLNR